MFRWGMVAGVWSLILVLGFVIWTALTLPNVADLPTALSRPPITFLDRDGAQLAVRGERQGEMVPVAALPPHLVDAVLAVEDRRFRSHPGIDPLGIMRAAFANLRAGHVVQGGSTITQQLAKNLFLTPDRTLRRKLQEALLAIALEGRYSKDEILTFYLNRVYLGAGAYGVEAASQVYFGKPATELDLYESAVVAGLLKAPSRYAPSANPGAADTRARIVLDAMKEAGFITDTDIAEIDSRPPRPRRKPGRGQSVEYFTDWVSRLVPSYVGKQGTRALVVHTTLDGRMQPLAEAALEGAPAAAGQAALVAIDPDGAVRALVGGRNYETSQFNRAVDMRRQPGSAFKPIIALAALEKGMGPGTMLQDSPRNFSGWKPENWDGKYEGAISMADMLARSRNLAAIDLLDKVGLRPVQDLAWRLGIASELRPELSMALGTSEVSPLEMATAFAHFANLGIQVTPWAITEITTEAGEVLYKRHSSGRPRVVDPADAARMNAMLTRVVTEGTGKAAAFSHPAAGKTGTTQDNRDAWFIGYTQGLVAAVWLGNDDNSPMKGVASSNAAAVWRDFMAEALLGEPARALTVDMRPAGQPIARAARPAEPGLLDRLLDELF